MYLQYLRRHRKKFTLSCVIFLSFVMWSMFIVENSHRRVNRKKQATVKTQTADYTRPKVLRKCTETTKRKDSRKQLTAGEKNILVLGYFRGGTTMLLDILSSPEQVFYVFEPISYLTEDTYEKTPITFLNGTKILLNKDTLPRVQSEMLWNWFSCNVHNINLSDLKSMHLHFHSRVTKNYFRCQMKSDVTSCIHLLNEVCLLNSNRLLKVVRLRISSAENLLKRICNLKIIYLIRDPRAMLHSLLRTKLVGHDNLKNKAKETCMNMLQDISSTLELKKKYPGNIFVVKYEALTKNPITVIKKIFEFSNLTFSLGVRKYVESHLMSHAAQSAGSAFLTKYGNASKIASKWRHSITGREIVIIDTVCKEVYDKLGYKQGTHGQVIKDLSVSLQTEPTMKEIFDVY